MTAQHGFGTCEWTMPRPYLVSVRESSTSHAGAVGTALWEPYIARVNRW
ncbi:hypothetical protein ACWEOE_32455 [Amycolatopsis sp. NPDC004368]